MENFPLNLKYKNKDVIVCVSSEKFRSVIYKNIFKISVSCVSSAL
jgi:hypothetical protein